MKKLDEFGFFVVSDIYNEGVLSMNFILDFGDNIGSACFKFKFKAPSYLNELFPYGGNLDRSELFFQNKMKKFSRGLEKIICDNSEIFQYLGGMLVTEHECISSDLPHFYYQAFMQAFLLALANTSDDLIFYEEI